MAAYESVSREEIGAVFNCRAPASMTVVKTPDFTKGRLNFEPAADLGCKRNVAGKNLQILRKFSPTAAQEYEKMVLLEALTYNLDRHLYNFGILRDRASGQVVSMAPVFDHNLSLSMALMDYRQIMAGKPDPLLLDWDSLIASRTPAMEPMKLPPIHGQVMQDLLKDIHVPGFSEEDKRSVIEILAFHGEKLQESIRQQNRL